MELRSGKRRSWDDEFVLKRQFSALIPAFDPRPGRTNVNQTSDLEIPPPGRSPPASSSSILSPVSPVQSRRKARNCGGGAASALLSSGGRKLPHLHHHHQRLQQQQQGRDSPRGRLRVRRRLATPAGMERQRRV